MKEFIERMDNTMREFKIKNISNFNNVTLINSSNIGKMGIENIEFYSNSEVFKANIVIMENINNEDLLSITMKLSHKELKCDAFNVINIIDSIEIGLGKIINESLKYSFILFNSMIRSVSIEFNKNYEIELIKLTGQSYKSRNLFNFNIHPIRDININYDDNKNLIVIQYLQIISPDIINDLLGIKDQEINKMNTDELKSIIIKYKEHKIEDIVKLIDMYTI